MRHNAITLKNLIVVLIIILFSFYPFFVLAGEIKHQIDNGKTNSAFDVEIDKLDDGNITDEEETFFLDLVKNGLSYSFRGLSFINTQYPGDSTQNPENDFLKLYRYSAEVHFRPDFYLTLPYLSGVFKPRMSSYYRWWEDGIHKNETDDQTEMFINEWLIQTEVHPTLFLSYGKEKLQWGSSFLASPSNPFFKDNEKSNPKIEVRGKYFFRLVYLPNDISTFTWMSNTKKEDEEIQDEFKPIHALKTEIMGENFLIGVIGSKKEKDRFCLGSFGQWTVSDSTIVYYDGIAAKGADELYPEQKVSHPFGGEFVEKLDNSNKIFTTILVGGSYTRLTGATFTFEFLYNNAGYDDAEAKEYYNLREKASNHFFDDNILSGISRETLFNSQNTGLLFLRRYYLMAQFQKREIKDVMDIIFRYTHNLEDNSGLFISIAEWGISDHIQLFNINNIGVGGRDTEFNSISKGSIMIGLEYTF